jgi:hypothetical protein
MPNALRPLSAAALVPQSDFGRQWIPFARPPAYKNRNLFEAPEHSGSYLYRGGVPMRRWWCSIGVVCLLLAGSTALGDEEPTKILDRAIQALGGEAKLAKWKVVSFTMKGKFYDFGGEAMNFSGDWAMQLPDRCRISIKGESVSGVEYNFTVICDRDHGWENTTPFTKGQVETQREELYEEWVTCLVPLKDKMFTLSALKEIMVDQRPAVGIRVKSQGHRDISIYFDNETALPVKIESQAKDDQGKQWKQESFPKDYQTIEGTQYPMKVRILKDGQLYLEAKVADLKFLDKLDEKLLKKP